MPFLLTDEPWIPCARTDGTRVELGLREALTNAHELRGLAESSPLVTVGLYRVLLAILHRCFGPANLNEWKQLYECGRFNAGVIEGYLRRWHDRFDLFHPEWPFYQCPDLPFPSDGLEWIIAEQSNYGAAVNLFQHRPESHIDRLTPAAAARYLLATHNFAASGLNPNRTPKIEKYGRAEYSVTAAPFNRGAVVVVNGDTLFETLMLNLCVYDPDQAKPVAGNAKLDRPAWESEKPPVIETRRPYGWTDLLTWQSRRLLLKRDESDLVDGVVYCVGPTLDSDDLYDPMLAWRNDEKRGPLRIEFSLDKALWRDADALVRATRADGNVESSKVIKQLANHALAKIIPLEKRLALELLGMKGDQAKILLVHRERLAVTPRLLADDDLGEYVTEALQHAEETAGALGTGLFRAAAVALAPGERKADPGDVTKLVKSLGSLPEYWSRLGIEFERFLDALLGDGDAAKRAFLDAMLATARAVFNEGAAALGTSARALKGASLGAQTLNKSLRDLYETRKQETEEVR